ncbi:MAG: helix-turn-helix transcriptional regulator [Clostridiales bacterium]|jgi:transcriptional regulator with XRE-family HTH domain|nr:helix-turn-helix transcriptional regulator [Clostridiales bacterium]
MNTAFPRILTLLRKERGISQKKASQELHISQALLSHYEKGIRECGLEFVVRVANYYHVSCDYLLGRTPDKSGAMIAVDEIPENDPSVKENQFRGSVLPTLNKKLIINSLHILFDLLQRCNNKALTAEASAAIMLTVYSVFRQIYSANSKNPEALFSLPEYLYQPAVTGELARTAAALGHLASGGCINGEQGLDDAPILSSDRIEKDYPLFASSLLNLLKTAETRLTEKPN